MSNLAVIAVVLFAVIILLFIRLYVAYQELSRIRARVNGLLEQVSVQTRMLSVLQECADLIRAEYDDKADLLARIDEVLR